MDKQNQNLLTPYEKTLLAQVMDRLIPPTKDIKGAGSMGMVRRVIEAAQTMERFRKPLKVVMDAITLDPMARSSCGFEAMDPEEKDAAIYAVEESLPEDFADCLKLVYCVYYSDPKVHKAIGWRTGPVQPLGFEFPPFNPSIIDKVKDLQPLWRKAE